MQDSGSSLSRIVRRYPDWILYGLGFLVSLYLLWQGRQSGLFPYPLAGTDQLTMLEAGVGLTQGKLPDPGYMYSPAYTVLLAGWSLLSGGNWLLMRIWQAALCALTPVVVRQLARELRFGRNAAFLAGLLYLFYGPALLIALDFLRAAPLALALSGMLLLLLRAIRRNRPGLYAAAGVLGGVCVLGRETLLTAVLLPVLLLGWPRFRRRIELRRAWLYLGGVALVVLLMVGFNGISQGAWSVVPGHYRNVMECYYPEQAAAGSETLWQGIFATLPERCYEIFARAEIPNSLSFYAHAELLPLLRMFAVPANLLWALALIGWWYGRRRGEVWLVALAVVGFAAALPWFPVYYRFRLPVMPLLAALGGGGALLLARDLARRRWSRALGPALAGLLVLVIFWNDPTPYRPVSERRGVAVILLLSNRLDEAERYIDTLEQEGLPTADLRRELRRRDLALGLSGAGATAP